MVGSNNYAWVGEKVAYVKECHYETMLVIFLFYNIRLKVIWCITQVASISE